MAPLDIAIDVSDAQGHIDWPAVRAGGIRIAFIKATEGATFVAKTFDTNRSGAASAGIIVIPYSFLRPVAAQAQIDHFRQVTGLEEHMPFALDWEGRASATCVAAVAEQVGEALALVANRAPIGYWGIIGSTPAAPTLKMKRWPRWVPRYPMSDAHRFGDLPARFAIHPDLYWPGATFGQYTSAGNVPGINAPVDRSMALFNSADEAVAWCVGKAS